jgi:hypothetical protein
MKMQLQQIGMTVVGWSILYLAREKWRNSFNAAGNLLVLQNVTKFLTDGRAGVFCYVN